MSDVLTPGDGQDLFARFKQAWEKRDADAMLELFSDDAEYRLDPFMQPLSGANAIREHWNGVVATQAHIEFDAERVWVSGRTVLGSWHAAITQGASGDRVRVRGFSTMELAADGRIVRMRDWPVTRTVGSDRGYKPQGSTNEAGE